MTSVRSGTPVNEDKTMCAVLVDEHGALKEFALPDDGKVTFFDLSEEEVLGKIRELLAEKHVKLPKLYNVGSTYYKSGLSGFDMINRILITNKDNNEVIAEVNVEPGGTVILLRDY